MLGPLYQQVVERMNLESKGILLANLLKDCAAYTESGNINGADIALYHLSRLASPNGDPLQRVATYFTEALAYCQVAKNLRGVPKVLRLVKTISTLEQEFVRQQFFNLYPFLKIAYLITNQAIIEAMQGEIAINVLDLSPSSDAFQWIRLMQGLKEHSPNTPCMKITITAIHEKKEVLEQMELLLGAEAKRLDFYFQFNPVVSNLESLDPEKLPIKRGEPLAISCVLQLHSLLATADDDMVKMRALSPFSPCPSHKMECFLNGLWKLQPRVLVITEQESNVNGPSLTERVYKALDFYGTLFDCLEASTSRTLVERSLMEKMLLGEEIKNIVACEGVERKERHEKLVTWIPRLELAGFGRVPISPYGIWLASKLLQSYVPRYHIHQKHKCLFICWDKIPLFSVSAWKF
uniref:Scarecrow-like protein 3 n=1 Tax=Cajanus cajan TaxID=3821 RepID=A0A151TM06_CAJCA|nr:Scarecrow-like protein 3 [Cajanus cajan]